MELDYSNAVCELIVFVRGTHKNFTKYRGIPVRDIGDTTY